MLRSVVPWLQSGGSDKMSPSTAGRKPFTEGLGLEDVGVKTDNRGRIDVDDHFNTNVKVTTCKWQDRHRRPQTSAWHPEQGAPDETSHIGGLSTGHAHNHHQVQRFDMS